MHAIYINAGVESPKCVRLDKTTLALLFDKAWGASFQERDGSRGLSYIK